MVKIDKDPDGPTLQERRAHLTDEIFQEMIENPQNKIPFLVNWDQVFLSPV